MAKRLNLRRRSVAYLVLSVLVILIAILMLANPDRSWGDVVFGPLLMLGGLIAIGYFDRVLFDDGTNEIIRQTGILVPFRVRRYARDKVKAVTIAKKTERVTNKERTTFPVRLSGIKDATILQHVNPWHSRVVAEQLARLIDVPLVNRVYGTVTTREPEELNMPLVERWRRDEQRFEKPAMRHDSDLQESDTGEVYELSIRAQFPHFKYLIWISVLLIVPAVIDVGFTGFFHSSTYRLLAVIFAGIAIVALAFVGRSRLTISPVEITFRQGYFPRRVRLAVGDIEELVIAPDGITLIADSGAVWVHWGGSGQDSDYLSAAIPYQLQRLSAYAVPQHER